MPLNELLVREFDIEMANTQKTLERVPEKHWDWKPHEKSGTLGWLAGHVATLPAFIPATLTLPELDFATGGGGFPRVKAAAELLPTFDSERQKARAVLAGVTEEQLAVPWSLKNGGAVIFTMPRYDVVRLFCMNHLVHHRAQLTMYLRALDVPVPALYGPSADEKTF